MVDEKIKMNVNETLELDYLVEEVSRDIVTIDKNPSGLSDHYISEEKYVFDPSGTGTYKISLKNQVIEIEVYDIPDSVLTQDLVAWYRFEDGDARDYASSAEFPNDTWGDSTAYDGTVNGATYQSNGGITDFETGANSGAFDFNGSGDIISQLIPANLLSDSSFTLMVWVNEDANQDNRGFLGSSDLFLRSSSSDQSGNVEFAIDDLGNFDTFNGDALTGWVHYAGTFDGSTTRVFANGQEGTSASVSGSFSHSAFSMGFDAGKGSLDAQLDDARIYNRALTKSEINNIYNATKP